MAKTIGIKKLPSGALQFVVFMGTVVSLLLFGAILLIYAQTLFKSKTNQITASLLESNKYWNTQPDTEHILNTLNNISLSSNSTIGFDKRSGFWGVFEKAGLTDSHFKITKKALLGGYVGKNPPAIVLQNQYQKLVVAGATHIEGDVFLSDFGVDRGSIGGKGFSFHQLVDGEINLGKQKLPLLDQRFIKYLENLLNTNSDNLGNTDFYRMKTPLKNSFSDSTITLFSNQKIYLENMELTGNILIISDEEIVVDATAKLADVLLVAPTITINDGVSGSFQAISNKNIYVGENCNLAYPTALALNLASGNRLLTPGGIPDSYKIFISKGTVIKGVLMYVGDDGQDLFLPQIELDENSTLFGQIYCTKNIELKGTVYGSIYADSFIALQNGYIFKNHLLDATINSKQLHD
ncbi:MAG: hypothetical protein Q8J97_13885, partial [Flavobacteriaceae bacterium]|nr:hypothetical protein [Flavobacteriaceae bacterium]